MDKSTKDSIEALEALLKIRECNEQASSSCATSPTTPTVNTVNTVNTSASSTISPSSESMRAGGMPTQQRITALNAIHHPQPTPTPTSAATVSTPAATSNMSGNGSVSFPYLLNALQAKNNTATAAGAAVPNPLPQQPNPLQASHPNPNRSVNFQLPFPSSLTPQQQLQQQLQHQHRHSQQHSQQHSHHPHQQLANPATNLALFATQNQQQTQNLPMPLVNFDPRIAGTLQQHQQQQQQQQLLHPSISSTLKDIVQPQPTPTTAASSTATILTTGSARTLTPIAMSPQPPGIMSLAPTTAAVFTNLELSKEVIRKEEIEAALKSKPQRGRKRENLSGLERQELTRTRNREHAKTTR